MKRALAALGALALLACSVAYSQSEVRPPLRRIRGPLTLTGPLMLAPGVLTVDGGITATSVTAETSSVGASFTAGPAFSGSTSTGALVASSGVFDGGVAAVAVSSLDLTATRNVSLPGMSGSSDGGMSFAAPPAGITATICATVATAVSLATLNTATVVTTVSSRYFTPTTPCFVVPPATLSVNVDYQCRASSGLATIYAKAGLVGLSASSGQWCAVVVGG